MRGDEELLAVFRAEVESQLARLAEALAEEAETWDLRSLARLAHNVKGAAHMVEADPVREAAHALEDLFSSLEESDSVPAGAVDLVRDGAQLLELAFATLDEGSGPDAAGYRGRVDAYLAEEAPKTAGKVKRRGAPAPAPPAEPVTAPRTETLRVTALKVDRMMGLATELLRADDAVASQNATAGKLHLAAETFERRHPEVRALPGWNELAELVRSLRRELTVGRTHHGKISNELQDAIRGLRMVRVDSLRSLLSKVVRDTARATGKKAVLRIVGGDTEIDRGVLDGLRDPLVHMIRNAVDHGLEKASERKKAGKDELGGIVLTARSAGSQVLIELADDGRGIDAGKLRRKAVEKGLVSAEKAAAMSESATWDLLFEAGFSTAETVSAVSGRGIGLDVVRENVAALGGAVRLSSSSGGGTAFELSLPLTRLTTRAVVVRLRGQPFLFPIAEVERTLMVDRSDLRTADGQTVVTVDDVPLPASGLETLLGLAGGGGEHRPAVVLGRDGERRAFLVDEVEGEREVTIGRLAWNLRQLPGVLGCTVLGEQVAPILDARELFALGRDALGSAGAGSTRRERRRHVLVADDSVTSRTLEKNILMAAGYEVTVARDGSEAWNVLRSAEVDLLVSDVDMPGIDGIELVRRLRSDERFRSLPVILVTSLGNEEHKRQGADAGADAYIVKGAFDQDELLQTMARLL